MKFQFRFASILQLRRQARDDAGMAVGQAVAAIARIDEQRQEIETQRETLRERDAQRTGAISVDSLLANGRYDLQLLAESDSLFETRQKLLQELDRRKQALTTAEAEVKRFEKLEDKDRAEFQAEQAKLEQTQLDEATSRRYAMLRRR
ncbi:MAG: flagellar export protein FliJ [Planctomycetota bacterium]